MIKYTAYRSLTKTLRGGVPGPEGSIEKLFWSEMYQRMLETALAIEGPYAQLVKGSPRVPDGGQWPHLMLYSRGRTIAAGQLGDSAQHHRRARLGLAARQMTPAAGPTRLSDLEGRTDPTRPPEASGVRAGSGPAEPTPAAGPSACRWQMAYR